MQVAEGIYTLDEVLEPNECQEYIVLADRIGYEAAPINTGSGAAVRPEIRNNDRVIIDDIERVRHLWGRVAGFLPAAIDARRALGLNERLRFYRYGPGQRFAPHYDGFYRRPNGEESLLTFMVYLNDGFQGGATRFREISIAPRTGMALVFDHALLHEGAPVIEGYKYVLRSDVMFEPPLVARR